MLIVIEAPGKLKSLNKALQKLGVDAETVATVGHIKGFSQDGLWPIGVNKDFVPTGLRSLKSEVVENLIEAMTRHKFIVIATDPDSEGHYIANDVLALCHPEANVSRANFYGFDPEHIKQGLDEAHPIDTSLADPASRRIVLDRVLSSVLSSEEDQAYAGRVITPTIERVSSTEQSTLEIVPGVPFDGVELVYHASAMLDKSPKEVAKHLQDIYESGKMSYHRSDSHRITPETVRQIGKAYGVGLTIRENVDDGVHPAPFPIQNGKPVDLGLPLDVLTTEDAIISIAGRQMANGFHEGGDYSSNLCHHAIEAMVSMGIGRPSTIPFISTKLEKNGTLDHDRNLTSRGHAWLEAGAPLIGQKAQDTLNEYINNGGDIRECLDELGIADKVAQQLDHSEVEEDMGFNHS